MRELPPYGPGVSVIIPERANPDLLRETLDAAHYNVARLEEPSQIIVVVNGSEPSDYAGLQRDFPDVAFSFHTQPLGFSRAIAAGLPLARYDWVYLLNNDMALKPDALVEVMRWRSPSVFAAASQIFFKDLDRRREETGWTGMRFADGRMEIFDMPPETPVMVRDHLYAGGGSSLYRKALLEEYLDHAHPYDPFYWEDVEWGIRAWKHGYRVLFCPLSRAMHSHRATVGKFYAPAEVDRIFERNGYRCQLRNYPGTAFLRNVATPRTLWGIARARLRDRGLPAPPSLPRRVFYPAPHVQGKPTLVVVSPYAIYPPAHGGAVRIHHLLLRLRQDFQIVLISDEGDSYTADSFKYFDGLSAVHLISGRIDRATNRIGRIQEHCHAALRDRLAEVLRNYRPEAVLVEFIEIAGLIELRKTCPTARWFLTLHDVLLSPENTEEDRFEMNLIRQFDSVIACSAEDAALAGPHVEVIANGTATHPRTERSSETSRAILFAGPFRYAPNLTGIKTFLEVVFPQLRERVPDALLWVLGGDGAKKLAADCPLLNQPGVAVFDYVEDVQPFLRDCAVSINPLENVRGSSVKLLETLAAGRVCVSTADGARGFRDAGLPALLIEKRIADFMTPVARLLLDVAYRHELEARTEGALADYDWKARGAELSRLIQQKIQQQIK